MEQTVANHCRELNRCNQRGGRMLSVPDLIQAGTMDLELAAYCMARIARGTSFMVGARPAGAGKTTVMCALLNLIPPGRAIVSAIPERVAEATHEKDSEKRCYVCHEISPSNYYAYLWGDDLRSYCALGDKDHQLATNLHADSIAEARHQVCIDNGIDQRLFNQFGLVLFLRVESGMFRARRTVQEVYASDGEGPHERVYNPDTGLHPRFVQQDYMQDCRVLLDNLHGTGTRTIEETREQVLRFFAQV